MDTTLWVILIIVLIIAVLVFGLVWLRKRSTRALTGGAEDWDDDWSDWDDATPVDGGCRGGLVEDGEEYTGGARTFRLAVREPWFDAMVKGQATVVGRLRRGVFGPDAQQKLQVGDAVTIARSRAPDDKTEYPGVRRYETTITHLKEYDSLAKLLKGEGMEKIFPGVKSEAAALKEFAPFFSEPDIVTHGVVAIGVKPPSASALRPPPPRAARKTDW